MRMFSPFTTGPLARAFLISLVPLIAQIFPATPVTSAAVDRANMGLCYRLTLGLWSGYNTWSETTIPLVVRFDSVRVEGSPGQGVMSPTLNSESGRNVGTWTRFGRDSVSFGWHSALSSVDLHVRGRVHGDSITGIAYSQSPGGFGAMAGMSAQTVGCPRYLGGE